jgi:GNAT superfamily N-acetyltransferase
MASPPFRIAEVAPHDLGRELLGQVEAVFFEASGRTLRPGGEREAFRERWLGRYLNGGTDIVLLAFAGDGRVAGYLVGALEDPAHSARFADLSYFRTDFAHLTPAYPAHLHINLAPASRGQGLGARLIEAFADRAARAGVPGMHVVTGRAMRNVRFYLRCAFAERGSAIWNGRDIVFLGRRLGPAPARG